MAVPAPLKGAGLAMKLHHRAGRSWSMSTLTTRSLALPEDKVTWGKIKLADKVSTADIQRTRKSKKVHRLNS